LAGICPTCFAVDGAPRLKGTTDVAGLLLLVDSTMTWPAVMVVPLTVPSTRTLSPFLMALAEVELVPLLYFVEDALWTVTFCPADVDTVKLDLDTPLTVPTVPPEAGPEHSMLLLRPVQVVRWIPPSSYLRC
jgi:hypothetical protein